MGKKRFYKKWSARAEFLHLDGRGLWNEKKNGEMDALVKVVGHTKTKNSFVRVSRFCPGAKSRLACQGPSLHFSLPICWLSLCSRLTFQRADFLEQILPCLTSWNCCLSFPIRQLISNCVRVDDNIFNTFMLACDLLCSHRLARKCLFDPIKRVFCFPIARHCNLFRMFVFPRSSFFVVE